MPGLSDPGWKTGLGGHVVALEWSPDGRWLAAASIEGPIVAIDASDGSIRFQVEAHGFGTSGGAISPDGRLLASGGQDGTVALWDAQSGAEIARMEAGADWVETVAWCPRSAVLASAAGRVLRLWDDRGGLVREFPRHPGTIMDLAWRPGRPEIASASLGVVSVWSVHALEPVSRFEGSGAALALAWRSDGEALVSGHQDASVTFRDLRTGRSSVMTGFARKVRELSFSGRWLATGGGPVVSVWDGSGDGPEGTEPALLDASSESPVSALAFRPGTAILAVGTESGRLRLWKAELPLERLATFDLPSEVSRLAWDRSGDRLAAGTASGEVCLMNP